MPTVIFSRVVGLGVFLTLVYSSLCCIADDNDEARLLYLNACRALAQIESVQAEFSVIDKKEIAAIPGGANTANGATKIQDSKMLCRGLFKGLPPVLTEDKKSNLFLWDTNVTNYEQGKTMPSMKVLFAGNPQYNQSKEGKLIPARQLKSDDDRDYLSITRMKNSEFNVGAFPSYSPQFQEFGRIQGTSAIVPIFGNFG